MGRYLFCAHAGPRRIRFPDPGFAFTRAESGFRPRRKTAHSRSRLPMRPITRTHWAIRDDAATTCVPS
jgi:hypothetical protein